MGNTDGSTGPHWSMDQTTAIADSMGIQAHEIPRWAWGVTMCMMYSDYYPVAVEFGLNRPEFYAALAKSFLLDKDGPGPERKLMETMSISQNKKLPLQPEREFSSLYGHPNNTIYKHDAFG